jgi:hypothetical protein
MKGISSSWKAASGFPALQQRERSLAGRGRRPAGVVGGARGGHRAVDVLRTGQRGACDLLPGGRVDDRSGLAAGRVDRRAVDEVLQRLHRGGHGGTSPLSRSSAT